MTEQLHTAEQSTQSTDTLLRLKAQLDFVRVIHSSFPYVHDYRSRTPEEVKTDSQITGIPINAEAEILKQITEQEALLS